MVGLACELALARRQRATGARKRAGGKHANDLAGHVEQAGGGRMRARAQADEHETDKSSIVSLREQIVTFASRTIFNKCLNR